MNIVVVESPAKAKTINKYLGPGYQVLASFGHIRDLPAKDGSVDPNADFRMLWEVDARSNQRMNDIARALKGADKLILATDPDREGEAISWHVLEVLKEKKALKDQTIERVVFNAITKQSILEAMKHPRAIDAALVDAYLARRALDYLVGFTLSPVLWRKLPGARSAGRVQSVALRLVCDRELEIEKFVAKEYWSIAATLATPRQETFEARLVGADGQKIQRLDIGSGAQAEAFTRDLESAAFSVANVEAKPARRNPPPPFTTSTMQQEASRKLGFAPAITMRLAQRLYEGVELDGETTGLITYMRTDGIDMAPEAIAEIRAMLGRNYGKEYVPASPREYHNKSKNAQEAHEAVRPTDPDRTPQRRRQICRPRSGTALRADLESRHRQPDGIRRTRTHHGRYHRQGRRPHHRSARLRPGREIRRLPHALPGRHGRAERRRREPPPARHERRRSAAETSDQFQPAFHRAAAAFLGSRLGQAHGGARHRPALDLCLDPAGAARSRLCSHRQEADDPRR